MTQIAELGTLTPSRGRQTRFTPERIQQIKNLVGRGKRREEIAELIGTTVGSLQVTCCRLGISLRRPNFNNGIVSLRRNDPRLKRIPSQGSDHGGDSALHLERNSQPQPIDEAEHLVPSHQVENRANEAGAASFAIKMQYRGEERTTELPLNHATRGRSCVPRRAHLRSDRRFDHGDAASARAKRSGHASARLIRQLSARVFPIVAMAATNKCLAQSNKSGTEDKATKKRESRLLRHVIRRLKMRSKEKKSSREARF